MSKNLLCLDLGGSKLALGIMTPQGKLLEKQATPWQPSSTAQVLDAVVQAARDMLARPAGAAVSAVGLAIPGPCDPGTGTWLTANFADIRNVPIARTVTDKLGLPAWADNDAKACALAERRFGAGKRVDDFLYLTVSNGIGGAVFAGGRLVRGAGGFAGEIGHTIIVPDGRFCGCGGSGCLEAYAAGPGLTVTFRELTGITRNGMELADLAREGDAEARAAWQMEGQYLGMGIANAVNLLNPELVILGGGLSLAFDLYEDILLRTLKERMFSHMRPVPKVVPTPLGYEGGLYGAAAVALEKHNK